MFEEKKQKGKKLQLLDSINIKLCGFQQQMLELSK